MGSKGFLELFRSHTGYVCDKWEQYLAVYDAEIGQLVARGQPLNLLEIGVQNGGSLEIWAKLLPAGSRITGIDIDPSCAALSLPANVRVVIGDASKVEFLQAALGDQTFDIVIDDGSHRSKDIVGAFRALFPRLRPSGKYFIEDLHASYWREFGGSFRGADSAAEFLKSLVDALHADHFKEIPAVNAGDAAALAALNRQIARLCFFDSLAVIEKYPREKTHPFIRTIAGAQVPPSGMEWRGYLASWSTPLMLFDDQVRQVLDADSRQEVARLGNEVERQRAELAAAETSAGKLRAQIADARETLARTSSEVLDVVAKLRERESELAAVQDELQTTRKSRERIRDELADLQAKRDALRDRLKVLKASWAWRLAWPIRKIERLLK